MPAWIAGIQAPGMRPDTFMSTWVPAVHAGTTSSYNDYVTPTNLMAIVLHPSKFSKEGRRVRTVGIMYFVPFALLSLRFFAARANFACSYFRGIDQEETSPRIRHRTDQPYISRPRREGRGVIILPKDTPNVAYAAVVRKNPFMLRGPQHERDGVIGNSST
jgi:hypothetical protein